MIDPLNFVHCSKCGYNLIAEEIFPHKCKPVMDYRIENNILWLNEGERWYPQKISRFSPNFKHPNGTSRDSTEPNFTIFYPIS